MASANDATAAPSNTATNEAVNKAVSASPRDNKATLTVLGASLIYFAMGLYFAAGSTGVYLSSYLIYRANSSMKLDDAIWFLSAAGFSALFLPLGGWLERRLGVRGVCLLGGVLQSGGVLATYFALDTSFLVVVVVYGGSFLLSLATCYTSPIVNVCKWHPNRQGLVSGISAASMAVAPTLFTPLITALVNPNNLAPNKLGLFDQADVLDRVKFSTLVQGLITLALFFLGSVLTFQAPQADDEQQPRDDYWSADGVAADCQQRRSKPASIEPKFAFRTSEFWLLSFKVLNSELIFIYLLFIYKPFGLTFIADDYFLSTVGALCALSNTLGRLSMGHLKDKFGYKAVSVPLSCATVTFIVALPFCKQFESATGFAICVVLAVGAVGSQYALMPSATQDSFGAEHASLNIGFVYMSTTLATVSSALLSQHMTQLIGWQGMLFLIAVIASADLLATLCMPSEPGKRLEQRFKQFYSDKQIVATRQKNNTLDVIRSKCPNCNSCVVVYVNAGFELDQVPNERGA